MITTIGFTGTRSGMSEKQLAAMFFRLGVVIGERDGRGHFIFIHGGCVGADIEFHKIALKLKHDYGLQITIEVYPGHSVKKPDDLSMRGDYIGANILHDSQSHFKRNRDIVDRCDVLFATPYNDNQEGGTWYTINYAKKKEKRIINCER